MLLDSFNLELFLEIPELLQFILFLLQIRHQNLGFVFLLHFFVQFRPFVMFVLFGLGL